MEQIDHPIHRLTSQSREYWMHMNTSLWLRPQACQHPWLQPAAVRAPNTNCDKVCVFAHIWRLGKFKFLYCTFLPQRRFWYNHCDFSIWLWWCMFPKCPFSPKPFVLSQHVRFSSSMQARARYVRSSKVQDSRFWKLPRISDKTVACIVPAQLLHHASGWQQLQSWSGRLPQPTNVR